MKKGELNDDKLIELFNVDEKSMVFPLVKKYAKDLIYCSEKISYEEYLDIYSYGDTIEEKEENFNEEYEEYYNYYKLARDNNWVLYNGSADYYDFPAISEISLDYEDDEIIIKTSD
jgi:hypothetical protein